MIPRLRAQLLRDEGSRSTVYRDSLGYWTIGAGFLVDARRGGGLPDAVRDVWLDYLVDEREQALRAALPWFDRLDEVRQGALLNMAYQLGVAGLLGFRATLARIRDGRYADAANEMLRSTWAMQTPDRARRVALQIETGEWQ